MKDYSEYEGSGRYYSGTERKAGILIGKSAYIVKFQKNSPDGRRMNHVSEYLGSRIFGLLGIPAQDAYLGKWAGEEVVCVRDFLQAGESFVPFNGVGESTLDEDRERFRYSYTDIMRMLRVNAKLTDTAESVARFWDIYIVDALLGNFDRHGSNWGFVKKGGAYRLAPVYDNGSCLFPALNTDEKLRAVLDSPGEMDRRIFAFPTSQIELRGRKSSYADVIGSRAFEECNQALARIVPHVDFQAVDDLIDGAAFCTDMRKRFYKTMLRARFEGILRKGYEKQ